MKGLLAAALSGVLMGLVFPKLGLWPLAWVGIVPLLAALQGVAPGRGFLLGFVFGVGQGLPVMYWLVWTVSVEAGFPLALGVLGTLPRSNVDISGYPKTEAWLKSCVERPASQRMGKMRAAAMKH